MYRVLVGGITHETNTFSPIQTQYKDFRQRLNGQQIIDVGRNSDSVIGGFVKTLLAQEDVEIIPSISVSAVPAGVVTADALSRLLEELLAPLDAVTVDAVLLDLHGAMYSELDADADGYILEQVRQRVGSNAIIGVTLDLHANLSQRMLDSADILITCDAYPHTDLYESGLKNAELTTKAMRGELKPVMAWKKVPSLSTLKDTFDADYAPIREAMQAWTAMPGVLAASVTHGFYMTDSADTHMAAVAITDGKEALAEKAAENLAQVLWDNRETLVDFHSCTIEDAYADAMKQGSFPVVFADVCDNPGAGGTGDTVAILQYLLETKAQRALVAFIADPESAQRCHEAGVGATVTLQLGNKAYPEITGQPISVTGYVKSLSDGKFVNYGPMYAGLHYDIGKAAVVVAEGVTILLASHKTQVYDFALFLSYGVDPKLYDIVVVKSTIHYKAAFNSFSHKNYSVEAPGLYTLDKFCLHYRHIEKDLYPLSPDRASG